MRSTRRGIVALLLACAVGGAVYSWLHRVELFVIPYRWREIRELYAACEAAEEEERARRRTDEDYEYVGPLPERKALDRAFCGLLKIQMAEFEWGEDFSWTELRADGGSKAYLVRYEPREAEDSNELIWPTPYVFVALDGLGRALDAESFEIPDGHVHDIVLLRVAT